MTRMRWTVFGLIFTLVVAGYTLGSANGQTGYDTGDSDVGWGIFCYQNSMCWSKFAPNCDKVHYYCVGEQCSIDDICKSSFLVCNNDSAAARLFYTEGSGAWNAQSDSSENSSYCEPIQCSASEWCLDIMNNSVCGAMAGGHYCRCIDGFSERNGNCENVLGQSCFDNFDCATGMICKNSECVCDGDGWKEVDRKCEPYMNMACEEQSDCGENFTCSETDHKCTCIEGYRPYGDVCVTVLWSKCTNATECIESYFECKRGYCQCGVGYGYTYPERICDKILDSGCNKVNCGNGSHYSYSYIQYGGYGHYHSAFFCNVDNICVCQEGFVQQDDACVSVYGLNCTTDENCGMSSMYMCDDGQCVCANHYAIANTTSFWTYYASYVPISCRTVIGLSCNDVNCSVTFSECNIYEGEPICECQPGYYEDDGICSLVLNTTCLRDGDCGMTDAECYWDGTSGICLCKHGYTQENELCVAVMSLYCTDDFDCPEAYVCSSANECECAQSAGEIDGVCISTNCIGVEYLNDLYRRSPQYAPNLQEIVIRDDQLVAGWYNIRQYLMTSSSSNPSIGHCGTYFPIYLKNALSDTDEAALNDGDTVSAIVEIGGLDSYDESMEWSISFRVCDGDLHVYLYPSPVSFAAYCIDNGIQSNPANTSGRSAVLKAELNFIEIVQGTLSPSVDFQCRAMDTDHTWFESESYMTDDSYYYTVHWWLNDQHYVSKGPTRRTNWRETYLSEQDILLGGYELGVKVQCAYEWSVSQFGRRSSLVVSSSFDTTPTNMYTADGSDGKPMYQLFSNVPIGCESTVGSNDKYCEIEWKLIDSSTDEVCSPPSGMRHSKCGIKMKGVTFAGYQDMGSSWSAYQLYNYYDNGHVSLGTLIQVSEDEHNMYNVFRAVFAETTSDNGHPFWAGYTLPDLKFIVHDDMWSMTYENCTITTSEGPTLTKAFPGKNQSLAITEAGTYLFYRSTSDMPSEVHVKIEACDTGLCYCGFVYQGGNSIYMQDYCSGGHRVGVTLGYGDTDITDKEDPSYFENYVRLPNGMSGGAWLTGDGILTTKLSASRSWETLADGEGLCSFTESTYRFGVSGEVSYLADGFANSWRIDTADSLFNPVTETVYNYTDTYYMVGCPGDGANVSTSDVITDKYGYQTTLDYSYGVLKLTKENNCSDEYEGEEWNGETITELVITEVSFTTTVVMDGSTLRVALQCLFEIQDDVKYKIVWAVDNIDGTKSQIYESDFLTPGQATNNTVTQPDLNVSGYALDKTYSCGVSVYRVQSTGQHISIMSTMYSEAKRAVEITTTAIGMVRGQYAVFTISINIPLPCATGQTGYIDIKLVDPEEDHSCEDTTIAMKNQYTCGQRIMCSNSSDNVGLVYIKVTSKNNNKLTDFLLSHFTLRISFETEGAVEDFLSGVFDQELTVFIRDEQRYERGMTCYCMNDPRCKTYDGVSFGVNNHNDDEFIMMRHTRLQAGVNLKMERCFGYQLCTCAVAVRAGRTIYEIDHCSGHSMGFTQTGSGSIIRVDRKSAHHYVISLPHGTIVHVYIIPGHWTRVNVEIYPNYADMNNVEGLCGNFDGNRTNDFLHSDNSTTPVATSYYWPYPDPDAFSESWSLLATGRWDNESLFNPDIQEDQFSDWSDEEILCVCTGSSGNGEVMCSANEDETCLTNTDTSAERKRRSVERQMSSGRVQHELTLQDLRLLHGNQHISQTSSIRQKRSAPVELVRRKRALTLEAAVILCEDELNGDCNTLFNNRTESKNIVNSGELIRVCAMDKQVDETYDWAASVCTQGIGQLTANLKQNTTMSIEFGDGERGCAGNCHGSGTCNQDVCECFNGFGNDDCSIDTSLAEIIKAATNGMCDRGNGNCSLLHVVTEGVLNTTRCRITHYEVIVGGNVVVKGVTTIQAVYINAYEIYCPIVESSTRRRRSTDASSSVAADSYEISVSNDGSSYSSSTPVVVLDSTCLNYSGSGANVTITLDTNYCLIDGTCYAEGVIKTGQTCSYCVVSLDQFDWSLKTDFCLIDSTCYVNATTKPEDTCKYCHVTYDTFDWTVDNETASCLATDSAEDGIEGYIIAIIVVVVLLVLFGAAVGATSYGRNMRQLG